jgi:surface protein
MNQTFMGAEVFDQDISDWNVSAVTNFEEAFANADSLSDSNKGQIHEAFSSNPNWPYDWREYVLIDDSNFQTAVNLWFDNQTEANATYGHIRDWNTSAVTNMAEAFEDRTDFNEDIGDWDVRNVLNMNQMFKGATSFNQDIGAWDVSSLQEMYGMFSGASSFNQNIGGWNTSSVWSMSYTFFRASSFNQSLSDWNVSSVTKMTGMFDSTLSFNQPLGSWDVRNVEDMRWMFKEATSFNQNLSDWNVSSVSDFQDAFLNTVSLSVSNKGLFDKSFSSNPNWPYNWSDFVTDTNQLDPPTDHNQTQPDSPDNNESLTQPPAQDNNQTEPSTGDNNATETPVVDGNQTKIPPTKDSNQTTIDAPAPELVALAPMVATYGHQRDENNTITLYGKIRSDGNGTIEQTGFYIRTFMDGNDTVLPADNLSKDDSFSITVSSRESFYFQAFARNEKGENRGTWKRVGAKSQILSSPISGSVETGDGWLASDWFGDFRYFENGWAYHYGLGWVYLSADGEDGIWLWRKEHGWLWSNQATWPFLWNHTRGDWIYLLIRNEQDPVFFDYSTGQYRR